MDHAPAAAVKRGATRRDVRIENDGSKERKNGDFVGIADFFQGDAETLAMGKCTFYNKSKGA